MHNTPYTPECPGLQNFQGEKIHISQYRIPDVYKDKTVLLVGSRMSLWDLVYILEGIPKKVILTCIYSPTTLRFKSATSSINYLNSIIQYVISGHSEFKES